MAAGDWWDQNTPDPTAGDTYNYGPPTPPGNTGVSGYGAPTGVPTPPIWDTGTNTPASTTGGTNKYGNSANLDRAYIEQQVQAAFAKAGKTPTGAEVNYWVDKISAPDLYSDNQWRVGWNPYWESRIVTGQGNPGMAGSEGLIANPGQYGLAAGGGGGGVGGSGAGGWNAFGAGVAPYGSYTPPAPYGNFTMPDINAGTDPGYAFTRAEGQRGIQSTAAARGILNTGSAVKALDRYNTGLANQTYGDVYNRALGLYNANASTYYGNANVGLGAYQTNRDTFYANQENPFSKWYRVAQLGATQQ